MVIKTEACSFTEFKIWPGRGKRFVARDSKTYLFIGSKPASLFHNKIKQVKLTWTRAWRRHNKKDKVEVTRKRRVRKVQKQVKAIVGATMEDIEKRRTENTELRKSIREQAIKEAKDR
jgi:large subunit ribosomal protein L24e